MFCHLLYHIVIIIYEVRVTNYCSKTLLTAATYLTESCISNPFCKLAILLLLYRLTQIFVQSLYGIQKLHCT